MNTAEIQARVDEIWWIHNYELAPGVMTHGVSNMAERVGYFNIPQDLSGKRVLDIGCADGYFTFLAESRGASVVAMDTWPREGFFLAREVLNSKAEFRHMSVYDVAPGTLGMFDIVFFFGVYYHLKNPILALERVASVTREYALIESEITPPPTPIGEGVSHFYEHSELNNDQSNWWVPNVPCLLQTIRAAGFPRAELVASYDSSRAVVRAYKGRRTAGKPLSENLFVLIESPTPKAQVEGIVLISGWALDQLKPQEGIEHVRIYLDNLDDPDSELGEAGYKIPRQDLAAGVNPIYGDVGFEFKWDTTGVRRGKHTLHILVEGKEYWYYNSVPIIVGPPETDQDALVSSALSEQRQPDMPSQPIANINQALAEITRLQKLVEGYERGRFIRFMKFLHSLQGK